MYHNFCDAERPDTEDAVCVRSACAQLEYLVRNFRVIRLAELASQLASGTAEGRTVAITVDDGRRNFYDFLFPLLKEFRVPATFFVVSSFLNREDWLWTDKVLWLAGQPSAPKELAESRIDSYFAQLNRMRPESRNHAIRNLAISMDVAIPKIPPEKYAPCSWEAIREMADSGLVEIGSHTATHPILSSLTDAESWAEVTSSRAEIEEKLGREVRSFCFPNGKPEDYRASQVEQVRAAGYTVAVTTSLGLPVAGADPLQLPRIGVSGRTSEVQFAKYLDGVEYYQQKLIGREGPNSPTHAGFSMS